MKRLILVRHAKTEAYSDAGSDFNRKLKKRGHKDATLVARNLKEKGYHPDVIISSPATRALQTAEIFSRVFDLDIMTIQQASFIYDGDTTAGMLNGISQLCGEAKTALVVGHNPDIAMLSIRLSGQDMFHFPTTASTVISFPITKWSDMEVGKGRKEYFIYPKVLKVQK
ncbi:SixA phosphatase family protein [Natronoflexus pectinivorans]|uniref:Phosphohistidine phosphatase n=1 Tax=Natronoflexus pectinivorans TaxID=682526 RepID=A0A4R2GGD8_9BACT|nr:histidine phosphatase family protein [Natronoflexus pectinivorans]TCO07315.1 phosphohistidine phosphatase [Natronoflexus pectinivorans]